MIKAHKINTGFTLIEMVITIVVLSAISLFTFSFLSNLTLTYTMMEKQRRIHQEAYYIVERITRELRDGSRDDGIKDWTSLLWFPNTLFTSTNNLFFKRVARPEPPYKDGNQYIFYYLIGSDLYRASAGVANPPPYLTNKIMGRNVSNFTVTYVPGSSTYLDDIYKIKVTLTREGRTVTYETAVCPKNYLFSSRYFTNRSFGENYEDVVQ
jgi:prepilin-type N-terminal cleavage/methylation domain-containing protein